MMGHIYNYTGIYTPLFGKTIFHMRDGVYVYLFLMVFRVNSPMAMDTSPPPDATYGFSGMILDPSGSVR